MIHLTGKNWGWGYSPTGQPINSTLIETHEYHNCGWTRMYEARTDLGKMLVTIVWRSLLAWKTWQTKIFIITVHVTKLFPSSSKNILNDPEECISWPNGQHLIGITLNFLTCPHRACAAVVRRERDRRSSGSCGREGRFLPLAPFARYRARVLRSPLNA